jgi:hypothetical protein
MRNFLKNILLKNNIKLSKYSINQKIFVNDFLAKIKIIDSNYELIRIGNDNDGGYLIPNILNEIDFCFSPGVGNKSSFEDHLLNFNIKSFLADGTIDYSGTHDFTKKNLNSFNDENNITLEYWVHKKIEDKSNDKLLLQMDIEGSEIEVLYNTSISLLDRFKCIVIEFHHFHKIIDDLGLKIYLDIFDKILKTHYIVHIHPNNQSKILNINEINVPNLLEITFINKKLVKNINKINYSLPHKLDKRCAPSLKEIKCPEIFYK